MELNYKVIDSALSDKRLKPYEFYLLLKMAQLSDERGILNISGAELQKETGFTNKAYMLKYIDTLEECKYIARLEKVQKKSTYFIINE